MSKSTDLSLDWAGDLSISSNGDLLVSNDFALLKQRIIRRLVTNPKDVIFEPAFGVGVGRYIDEGLNTELYSSIRRKIIEQVYQEDLVSRNPEPVITFQDDINGLICSMTVWLSDNRQLDLNLRINNSG